MITAEQARELNPFRRIKEYENFIEKKIRDAALAGDDYVIVKEEPYSKWIVMGDVIEKDAKKVVNELRQNGFSVISYFLESTAASYSGLKISWGKAD